MESGQVWGGEGGAEGVIGGCAGCRAVLAACRKKYIEEEMARRRGKSVKAEAEEEDPQRARMREEEDLYHVPDSLKALTPPSAPPAGPIPHFTSSGQGHTASTAAKRYAGTCHHAAPRDPDRYPVSSHRE